MFTVKCAHCKRDQLYQPRSPRVVGKSRKCVFCGKSFSIHANLQKTNIVCEGKKTEFNVPL